MLFIIFLNAPPIPHQLLHHLPVHEGLAAEEVDLYIFPVAGFFAHKIESLFPGLKVHETSRAVVFALSRKAVTAI